MFRLTQVTDPHFRSFAGARATDFLGKRFFGALNLVLNRRRKHRMEYLCSLLNDLRVESPDHLAVTGDLSNVSLVGEWSAAIRWLEATGLPAETTTVIPGNHDAYVSQVTRSGVFERIFAPYQTAEFRIEDEPYPFARLRGEVAIVAVNTCVATRDLGSWGEIGQAQLERLQELLDIAEVRRRFRVVLLHHPPIRHRGSESRNLRDRADLVHVLAHTGADLVLHGHDHRDERAMLHGASGRGISVVGAGSASYVGDVSCGARYNLYEIGPASLFLVTRAYDPATGSFREVHRANLT